MPGVFIASLAVAVTTIIFTHWQVKKYCKLIAEQLAAATTDGSVVAQHYGLSPQVVASWWFQGLDVATNFPATILTLVAYGDWLARLDAPIWVYVVAGVAVLAIFLFVGSPRRAAGYAACSVGSLSSISAILLAANIVGLIIALWLDQ